MAKIISWDEIEDSEVKEPDYLINPYVVKEGITFIWGKTSIGKSPLSWWMAKAIGSGEGFFGLPSFKGKVLYIDVDSPETVLIDRLKKLTAGQHSGYPIEFVLSKPFTFPGQDREQDEFLAKLNVDYAPDCVFLNTLRKVHDLDDKESLSPKRVYSYYQHHFPKSALVFIHHSKKESLDPKARVIGAESFSGSQAWLNDAQAALHLEKYHSKKHRQNLRLIHIKSQFTDKLRPLPLHLEDDGTTMSSYLELDLKMAYEGLLNGDAKSKIYSELMERRGMDADRARHTVQIIEQGGFPDSRGFLSRLGGFHEENE